MSRLRRVLRLTGEEGGFSLVELMVVIFFTTVIAGMVTSSVITALQAQRRQMAQLEALNDAKLTLERMTRDVRAANPLEQADADRIDVSVERDGVEERSTFLLEPAVGGTRRLVWCRTAAANCTGAARRTLLDGVSTASGYALLRYVDADGVELPVPLTAGDRQRVQTVRIALRVEVAEHDRPILLDNDIALRNWRP